MEDLWQEVAHGELNASPMGPPLGHWRTPAGGRDPNVEDEEVTFQGRWGPSELLLWPTGPLIQRRMLAVSSVLAAGLRIGTPRINTFSGNATPGKTEVSLKQWYHKVQCIKDHHLELVVWENIVRPLKGAAADMA